MIDEKKFYNCIATLKKVVFEWNRASADEYPLFTDELGHACNDAVSFLQGTELNAWHVVSDGDLPKESGHYLVTYHSWSDGEYLPKYDDTYVRRLHYQNCDSFIGWNYPKCLDDKAEKDSHKEVIAWMELPQPYKERD